MYKLNYHPTGNNEAKTTNVIEGYRYLISKNPENLQLEKTLQLQLDELEMANQGFLLTGRFRREKYKYLKTEFRKYRPGGNH